MVPQRLPSSEPAGGLTTDLAVDSNGTVALPGPGAGGPGSENSSNGVGGSDDEDAEAGRVAGPAVLSLWVAIPELESGVMVQPTTTLLVSVPGYRDLLRGSGIAPFSHLTRLRVRIRGMGAESLLLAGVHAGGAVEVERAAERIATMRGKQLDFRGDSTLRASAWVDGSGYDRGLAINGGSFVIASRTRMARVLGKDPSQRLRRLSSMRERSMLRLVVEDVSRYFPHLATCRLQAIQMVVVGNPPNFGITVQTEYQNSEHAGAASSCLAEYRDAVGQPTLHGLLMRARAANGSRTNRFSGSVSKEEVHALLEDLARAFRTAARRR